MRSSLYGGLMFAALACFAAFAGCGGGSDHLTKAEFDKQANAICKKGNQEINQAAKTVFTTKQAPSKADFEKFANDTLIPSVQKQIDQISDLNPPSADEDQVNAIVDEAQSALDQVKKDPTVLEQENNDPFKKANQLANAYGMTVCGQS
jgi:hypothetical protein